jgi:hypothetical protein
VEDHVHAIDDISGDGSYVSVNELESIELLEYAHVVPLLSDAVAIVDRIDTDDSITASEARLGHVRSDESGASGDEHSSHGARN